MSDRRLEGTGYETMREFMLAESDDVETRLDHLRVQIENECISYGELAELQDLGEQGLIPDHEIELRQWAGLPEFPEDEG